MRNQLLFTTFLLGACYNPTFVSGQVECGPGGACPEGFVCRTDNRCWQPDTGGDVDMSGAPPADLSMSGGDGGGGDLPAPASRFLTVKAGRIVNSAGAEVRLTGVNWPGMEGSNFAPLGLNVRRLGAILDTVKALGYNTVRLPYASRLLNPAVRASNVGAEPDLAGKSGQEVLDRVITAAGDRGLRVILARYGVEPGVQTPLWYTAGYPEARWISDWTALARRYRNNPTVVAFDLHHEVGDTARWSEGGAANDWRAAAERAGNAVLAVHPEVLIIVQGVGESGGVGYWQGGNLKGAGAAPVRLSSSAQLVYGTNDYPPSVVPNQPWFMGGAFPNNLPAFWDGVWGYLVKDPDPAKNTPVLISGFGGKLESNPDRQWIGKLGEYIGANRLSFAYWSLNPDGFYGGLLGNDWVTVQDARHNAIKPYLAPLIP